MSNRLTILLALCLIVVTQIALAQTNDATYAPTIGQAGKDVVWVPTPPALVEKMLDVAKVTPQDFVVDLGSGDGRNVIAAAKRGARALGVEFNPDMVELSKRAAEAAGVADKARFVQGDMFAADVSDATVLALFLIPENLSRLRPKFLSLKPGTRIVSNTFEIEGWSADEVDRVTPTCLTWCAAYLYIVPAKVAGTWSLPQGELKLEQNIQMLNGTLSNTERSMPITLGRLNGDQIYFMIGDAHYAGRVSGDRIIGDSKQSTVGAWTASRMP